MRKLLLLSFLFFWAHAGLAAQCYGPGSCRCDASLDLYWKGGNGLFNDTLKWDVGFAGSGITPCQVPRSTDNIFFTAGAFGAGAAVSITVDRPSACANMNWDAVMPRPVNFVNTNTTQTFDVYGDFVLAANSVTQPSTPLNFAFNGTLRLFSSRNGTVTINPRGQRFRLIQILVGDILSNSTIYNFVDSLHVDDPNSTVGNYGYGGAIVLQNGLMKMNGNKIRTDFFNSTNGKNTRGLDISNCSIEIYGDNAYAWHWSIDFNATNPNPALRNYSFFNAANSTIRGMAFKNMGYAKYYNFGIGLKYNILISDAPSLIYGNTANTGGLNYATMTLPSATFQADTFSVIRLNSRAQFGQTMNIVVDDLYLQPNETYSFIANYQSVLTVENIYRNPGCNELITLEVTPQSGTGTRGIINKKTAGTNLTLDYFIINDVECNTAGGRTYTANNSLKFGYTPISSVPFNWTLNTPTISAYYFVGSILTTTATLPSIPNSYAWSNPANWRMYNPTTGALGATATCVPSAIDDVYFGSASFPSYTYNTTVTFNNAMHRLGQVQIDTIANCHNMYWLNDLKKGSSMSFSAPNYMSGATALRVYGSAWYNKKMNLGFTNAMPANANSGNNINYYGVADTISGDSSIMLCTHNIMRYANYDIIGDLDTNTRDWTFYQLVGQGITNIRTNFIQLNTTYRFYPNSRNMDSTQVYYTINGGNFTDNGGAAIYTGNTTFHFWGGITPTPAATCNVDAGRMPNVIALCNMSFNTTYWQVGGKCEIQGDAFFAENGYFYNTLSFPHYHFLDVNGAMALYDGNVTFSAGKTYEWAPNPTTSRINIAGWLRGTGTCTQNINWRTLTGIAIPVTVGNAATSNLDYFAIEGMNNVGATLIANNSINIANNTNITFAAAGASRTYYWRAHATRNPLHYTGNWSDANYWSLDPLSVRGDNLCLPTIRDTVVFDTLSKPNATYALTDTCIINGLASCKVLWFKAGKNVRSTGQGIGRLTIDGSLLFDGNYTWLYNYSGSVYVTGSGNIVTNNTQLKQPVTYFGKPGSTINFMDNITFSGAGLTPTQPTYGQVYLSAGTLNTNNNTVNIASFFSTINNTEFKTLNLGTSQVNLLGYYSSLAWYIYGTTINTISAVNSTINFKVPPTAYNYLRGGYFGVNYNYGNINFEDPNNNGELQGSNTFKYVTFLGNGNFSSSNTFDSLFFSAGKTYRLAQNTIQTLRAPYGKIIANGTNSNYINIETPTSGVPLTPAQRSKFYKPFGTSFCVYFVRVKENEAYTNATATIPSAPINGVNWQSYNVNFPLWFQTDFNSDNVNGTAINRWDFTLPVDFNPTITGSTSFTLCAWAADQTVTLPIYGNAPYILSKTWTNTFGQSGTHTDTIPDNDNNPNTPFNYQLTITQPAATTTFNILLNTVRCGISSTPLPVGVTVTMPNPNTLVDVDRTKSCVLNNSPAWFTFLDPVNSKPMVSIQDKVNAADNVALGNVDTEVRFTPTVQYLPASSACYANAPYLQRYWHITPANNSQANVRLYFTTAELTYLTYRTTLGATRLLDVATEIKVLKYPSGIVGVGACQEMTHTVVNWTPSVASPFTSTSGVIGVEFPVSSFSAFVIVPTTITLLSLEVTNFDAQLNNRKTVDVSWATALEENMSHFVVERSKDGFSFEEIGRTPARNNTSNAYTFEDKNPQIGFNYYRVRGVDNSQAYTLTDTRVIELQGAAIMDVFPNPTDNELNVRLFSNSQTDIQMQVIDALGRVLIEQNVTKNAGQEQFQLNTSRLSAGMYILRLTDTAGNLQQVRFVKE